jgi:hypothetical protein
MSVSNIIELMLITSPKVPFSNIVRKIRDATVASIADPTTAVLNLWVVFTIILGL